MLKRVFLLPLLLFIFATGCKKDSTATTGVPNVSVNATINVDNANYVNLQYVGGWEYTTGGYDGLLIYCNTEDGYLAYDRGCPYDCETNSKAIVTVQTGGIEAKCPVCGTVYNLLNGTIISGPGSIALKQYQTTFSDPYIYITN